MPVIRDPKLRVINVDWLEVYVSESIGIDYTPDGFRNRGWYVVERGYGTKTMEQVFTLCDMAGLPFVEIRRCPRTTRETNSKAIYYLGDAYLRLVNEYCYRDDAVDCLIYFMEREHFQYKRIYRLDIALDFIRFDNLDYPQQVARRIVTHKYAKVNQLERQVVSSDLWTGSVDHSFRWGRAGSMVVTRFYNKTKEVREAGLKKHYIIAQWLKAGYIDNPLSLTKNGSEVAVWRIEFEIKSSAKGYVQVDEKDSGDGQKYWLEHNLDIYATPRGLINAFANLLPYYFRFKIYKEGVRKSRCPDKVLFTFSKDEFESGFRLTNESDFNRMRHVDLNENRQYEKALSRAFIHAPNEDAAVTIQQLQRNAHRILQETFIRQLQDKIADETTGVF